MTSDSSPQPRSGCAGHRDVDPDLAAIERALIRIRRRQFRRELGRLAAGRTEEPIEPEDVAVIDAIDEGAGQGGEVTVGDVGERLGVDASRASRMVAAAIGAELVRRVASQHDGRRTCLELTAQGQQVIEHAHRSRQGLYGWLLADWSPDDRTDLARLLTRFTEELEAKGRCGPGGADASGAC